MTASIASRYGPPDVLVRRALPMPTPRAHEVLVRVRATTVSAADARLRAARVPRGFGPLVRAVFGVRRLRQPILGGEFAGDVVAVGPSVRDFTVGDAVMGLSPRLGAHAEFLCVPAAAAVTLKPAALSYEHAAALPFGGLTMLGFYRRASLSTGERVLVNGASGAVGVAAVQLAVARGAEVHAVCSGANEPLVRSLGAHDVIDYAREDFARRVATYDLVVDAVGNAGYDRVHVCLTPRGRLLAVVADLSQLLHASVSRFTLPHRVLAGSDPERAADVQALLDLAHAGHYRAVIGRRFTFDQLPDAHRYVDSGRKVGSAVVVVCDPS